MTPRSLRRATALALVLACASCVTVPQQKAATRPGQPGSRPIDPSATASARARFSLRAIGQVDYDGLCQPLISPDGAFLAAQQGRPPTWPALLALDGAAPPAGSSIAVYSLSDKELSLHPADVPLPKGLILGRSADAAGFLVESPQEDGSRWIGKVDWSTGRLTWLVNDQFINAQATLGPRGELAFTRRPVGGVRTELVLRTPAQDAAAAPRSSTLASDDESYLYPLFGDDPSTLAAYALLPDGLDLVLIRPPAAEAPPGAPLALTTRRFLVPAASITTAYQSCAAAQTPLPPLASGKLAAAIAIVHPASGQAQVISLTDAKQTPLLTGCFAAVRAGAAENQSMLAGRILYLQSTPGGLVLGPLDPPRPTGAGRQPAPPTLVSPAPSLARATSRPGRFIVVGPVKDPAIYACEIGVLDLVESE